MFKIHERKRRESSEINNLERKVEYDKSTTDQGNIINVNSWKSLLRKINMVRRANTLK